MVYTIAELICYFGGLLGILVSIVILLLMKGKPLIKMSLALFMIISALVVIIGTLTYSGKIVYFPHLFRIDSPLHYLFPAVVLFYVYSTFKPDLRFKKIHLLSLLPFFFNLFQLLPFYFSSAAEKIEGYQVYVAQGSAFMPVHYTLKTLFTTLFFLLEVRVFYKYKQKKGLLSAYQSSLNKWFLVLFIGQGLFLGGLFLEIFSGFSLAADPYRFSVIVITYFIYQLSLSLLFLPHMLYGNISEPVLQEKKYQNSRLDNQKKIEILEKLESFMKQESKPYLNPKLSLEEVSLNLNVQAKELSQVVNEKTDSNFNQYVNKFRVEESQIMLDSTEYTKLTIEAIAHSAGFNSKSQFYESFKKNTGITPKKYADNISKK
jgi:AraC-like DNA-binding protein